MTADRKKTGEKVALSQDHQLKTLQRHMGKLEEHTSDLQAETGDQADALSDLDARMSVLLSDAGLDRPSNSELEEVEIAEQFQLSESEATTIRQRLPDLSLGIEVPDGEAEWASYLHEVDQYIEKNAIDLTRDPLEQLLPPHRAAEVHREFEKDFGPSPWDRWDYGIIASAVIAGTLLDYFIVATPLGGNFRGVAQRASPLTSWMREKSELPLIKRVTKWAEANAKVSYDHVRTSSETQNPHVHRLTGLAHDPILGLLYGVVDILLNRCTFVDGQGRVQVVNVGTNQATAASIASVPEAFLRVILHYLSDVFTEKGLPSPLLPQLQRIQADSGFTVKQGGDTLTINELTRYMYRHGYDFRHFLTMSIVPGVAELVIRTYHAVRNGGENPDVGKEGIRGKLKLSKMLMVTHALLSGTNILKTALYRWNPTALNVAQFAALAKEMFCLWKLSRERDELIQIKLEEGYRNLLRQYEGS